MKVLTWKTLIVVYGFHRVKMRRMPNMDRETQDSNGTPMLSTDTAETLQVLTVCMDLLCLAPC